MQSSPTSSSPCQTKKLPSIEDQQHTDRVRICHTYSRCTVAKLTVNIRTLRFSGSQAQWGLWVFFSKPNLRHVQKEEQGICYGYFCVGTSLMGRSYFWQDLPYFFGEGWKFYESANGYFLVCHDNSQKLPNGDWENYWRYMSHGWFLGTPNFYRGKNVNCGQHFRHRSELVAYYSTTRMNMENQKHELARS